MRHSALTAVLATAALSFGAAPASAGVTSGQAADPTVASSAAAGHELRVVNNHMTSVRVFVTDAEGRLHHLGQVRRGQYKVLNLPADITAKGSVRVQFLPADRTWSSIAGDDGIVTSAIELGDGQAVHAFLEAELAGSEVEIANG